MRLKLVTGPTVEPVTAADAILHARLDGVTDSAIIAGLIATARELAETYTRRAFMAQTWKGFLDAGPCGSSIEVPRPPLQSVTHVKTYTDADVATTMSAALYYVDTVSEPGRIVLRDGASWPDITRVANGLEIQFIAGYTTATLPQSIKTGILNLVAWLYEHRGDGTMPPAATYAALDGDRLWLV